MLSLEKGEEKEIVFFLGSTGTPEAARALLQKDRNPGRRLAALEEVKARWEQVLTAVQVSTPDRRWT